MDLQSGALVERYTVEGVLGRGAMAVVYRVRHNQLGTLHAMKVLTVPSRSIRQRLVQEGRLQASMQHPNVVSVTDVIEIDGAPGLLMELIRGPSLDRLLAKQRLTLEQCDSLVPGILAGVAAAHARGLVHRDLKPGNIMVQVTNHGLVPKIADFGLAKILEGEGGATATRTGQMMGTPSYMAPEQIRNSKRVDHRADVFALGAILYEMVTGLRCFDGEDLLDIFNAIGAGRYQPPRELVPDLPDRMERAIVRSLEVDRDERLGTVDDLLAMWRGEAQAPASRQRTGPFGDSLYEEYAEEPNTADTAIPPSGADATFDDSAGSLDRDPAGEDAVADALSALRASGSSAPAATAEPLAGRGVLTMAVTPAEPTAPLEPRRAALPFGWVIAGVGGLGIVAVGGVALALGVGVASGLGGAVPQAGPDPAPPVVAAPEPAPGTPDLAPAEPAQPAPVEAPATATAAVGAPRKPTSSNKAGGTPAPTGAPAPTGPGGTPAPTGAEAASAPSSPEPAPVETTPPPPVEPAPALAAPATGLARVQVDGTAARLMDASQRLVDLPADVPPGTYGVYVGTTRMLEVTVAAGETVQLKCGATKCVRR